jgi:hypothetical protein
MARRISASRPLAAALALCLAAPPGFAQPAEQQLRITGTVTNVRESASPSARVLFQLKAGDVVRLLATTGSWYRIESGGKQGYVLARLAEIVPAPPPPPAAAGPASTPPPPTGPAPTASGPAPAVASLTIDHKDVGCVVAGEYPKLDACFVPADALGKAEVHFRAAETDPWYAVALSADGPCHSAFLPKPNRDTAGFDYYIDAIDRSVAERFSPAGGPASPQHVTVVKDEKDCGAVARIARSVGKLAKPIVVAIVRDPAGNAVVGAVAEALAAKALLVGFSQQGVALATGAAASASTAGASTAAAGGGGGGAAGGIGATTIAIGAGAAAAAVAVAVAAGGGGDSGSSSGGGGGGGGGGSTPTPTPTPAPTPTLTGTFVGPYVSEGSGSGFGVTVTGRCSSTATLNVQQQGSTATGNIRFTAWTCQTSVPGFPITDFVPPANEPEPVTFNVTGNTISVEAPSAEGCPPSRLTGTFTANQVTLNGDFSCTIEGVRVTATSSFNGTRQ